MWNGFEIEKMSPEYMDISTSIRKTNEYKMILPASAAGSAANAAIEKLNEPGVENNLLSAGPIKNGGAVCECILLSISSSLFELH